MEKNNFYLFNAESEEISGRSFRTLKEVVEALDEIIDEQGWGTDDEMYVLKVNSMVEPVDPSSRWKLV